MPNRKPRRKKRDPNKPPQFRGSDFTMRWEQGRWAEEVVMKAINSTRQFRAIPYGRSQISVETDHQAKAEYWRNYVAVEKNWKRPDFLLLRKSVVVRNRGAWRSLMRNSTVSSDQRLSPVLRHAICGLECENSLWKTKKMPDAGTTLPLSKLQIIAPRIWVKEEDTEGLSRWSRHFHRPIVVVQVFFDSAYAVTYKKLISRARRINKLRSEEKKNALQKKLGVILVRWGYPDSRTGRETNKLVYTCHHTVGVRFGDFLKSPGRKPRVITNKNGKMMPYVRFVGGRMRLTADAIDLLRTI